MNIAVIGLGYVGCIAAAKLSLSGHEVVGVDINPLKVQMVSEGRPTVIEPGLDDLFSKAKRLGRLRATSDLASIIDNTDILYLCLGTPQTADGDLDMNTIFQVVEELAQSLGSNETRKTLVTRSTVRPGTNARIRDILADKNISVVMNPEFIREGKALDDWDAPGLVVIGAFDDYGKAVVESLHAGFSAPIFFVQPETAELIKYVNNSWHALKVAFGNEIGRLCRALAINHEELMDIFLSDEKLNLSSYYLRPGMPYGGSCLPKDLSALGVLAREKGLSLPVLEAVDLSNSRHVQHMVDIIYNTGKKKIGIEGLAFKKGTDDLRNSPTVSIIKELVRCGADIFIHDGNVHLENLLGQNREQAQDVLPILQKCLVHDFDAMVREVDVVAVMHDIGESLDALKKANPDKIFINLAKYKI